MNSREYQELVKSKTPKDNHISYLAYAFLGGGVIGLVGQVLYELFLKVYSSELSITGMLLVLIAVSSFITCLGFGDKLFAKVRCGLIIPITGFAHSVASSIIDYKKEGLLNMGSNAFKLAGSVILYGVVSGCVLTLVKVIING